MHNPIILIIVLVISNITLILSFVLLIKPIIELFKSNEKLFVLYEDMTKAMRDVLENNDKMITCQSHINDNLLALIQILDKERK